MSDTIEFLKQMVEFANLRPKPEGFKYGSYEELVLTAGTDWSEAEVAIDLNGPVKNCFENSLSYALENGMGYLYCEGYAYGAVLPVMHAWVLHEETGDIIETTWRDGGTDYIGIAFDPHEALDRMLEQEVYGLLGNDWMNGHRLLKEGVGKEQT